MNQKSGSFFVKAVATACTLMLLLCSLGASFAATPDADFVKYADQMDQKMFPIFLETVKMINDRNFSGLEKYYQKSMLERSGGRKIVSIAELSYPPRYFRIQPFNNMEEITFPINWKADPYNNISWQLWYQNLSWLRGALSKAENGDEESAKLSFRIIEDWIVSNTAWPARNGKFVYEDHACAERLKILNQALRAYNKSGIEDELFHNLLLTSIVNHIAYISSEEFYKWNNHGIMMDAALLEALKDTDGFKLRREIQDLAVERVTRQFQYTYTEEGVHKEHSACYHVWVTGWLLETINSMEKSSLPVPRALSELASRSADYYTYIIKPDATFPMIGDCNSNQSAFMSNTNGEKLYQSHPELLYSVSKASKGVKPRSAVKVFAESGVAVFRDKWPADVYAVVQSAFHSDVHKHEDDTSFVLSAYGKDLIVDAGLHSYENGPLDIYSTKASAHNVMLVDDQEFNLNTSNAGLSGITRFLLDPDDTSTAVVELTHPHYQGRGVKIFRQFAQMPNATYLVKDIYKADAPHTYRQLFHLAPDAKIQHKGDGVLRISWAGYPYVLWLKSGFDSYEVVEGSLAPVEGWYFPQFGKSVPVPVLRLSKHDGSGELQTLLAITKDAQTPAWEELAKAAARLSERIEELPQRKLEKETIPTPLAPSRKLHK